MDKCNRAVKCALYSLRKLFTKPKGLAILLFVGLYLESVCQPLRAFLTTHGESVNGFGWFAFLLSDSMFGTIAGIGLMLLLGDAPFYDEAQPYVLLRGGKGPWVTGQILYIFGVTALYLLVLVVMEHMVLAPRVVYDAPWGRALRTLAETPQAAYDHGLGMQLPGVIVSQWSPRRAFLFSLILRWIAYVSCALIMFTLNLTLRNKLGLMAASLLLLLDPLIDTSLPYVYFIVSPVSLSRLCNVDFGYNPYLVDVEPSMMVLCGVFAVLVMLASFYGRRCDLVSASQRD